MVTICCNCHYWSQLPLLVTIGHTCHTNIWKALKIRKWSQKTKKPVSRINMTETLSDSIRERQYGQYCHKSSQLSQKFTTFDNCHNRSNLSHLFMIFKFVTLITFVMSLAQSQSRLASSVEWQLSMCHHNATQPVFKKCSPPLLHPPCQKEADENCITRLTNLYFSQTGLVAYDDT